MSDWGQGAKNNNIGWGQGAVNNDISWGSFHTESWAGDTDINGGVSYFVRPSGTTYGDGSGTSYANAWSGFSSINWTLLENEILNVCGTFNELLLVQQNNVTIVGNNILGAGIINGQSARVCLNITGYNNTTINGITCNNGLVDNLRIVDSIGNVVNDSMFDTSTNQTVQHGGTICVVEYNNCTFKNGVDDGISLHDFNTTVTLNDCHFEGNDMGLQSINGGQSFINNCTFVNNTTLDIRNDDTSTLTAIGCTFTKQVSANSSGLTLLKNCTSTAGVVSISTTGNFRAEDCKFIGTSQVSFARADITKCIFTRCYFEIVSNDKMSRLSNGVANITYCTFRFVGNFVGIIVGGTGTSIIENCNFISATNIGTAITALGRVNVKNTIFQGLNRCVNTLSAAGIVNLDYCNTYLNTTIHIGSGTFTNTNSITTNPLFTNISTLDFRLQAGSGSLNSGATLTNATGILSADWVSTIPTVTTINQSGTWDRGAYVQ